jgi:cytochrome c oxidase subunit I
MAKMGIQGDTPDRPRRRNVFSRGLLSSHHRDVGGLFILTAGAVCLIAVVLTVYLRLELREPGNQYICQEGARLVASSDLCTFNMLVLQVLAPPLGTLLLLQFALVPALLGAGILVLPSQLGAPDLAFPRIGKLSFWLYLAAVLIGLVALLKPGILGFAHPDAGAGWALYQPRSVALEDAYATDIALQAVRLCLVAVMLGALNLVATVAIGRAKGQTLRQLPFAAWLILGAALAALAGLPRETGEITARLIDRNFGVTFFQPSGSTTGL